MTSELALNFSEFAAELDALAELVSYEAGGQTSSLGARARVAAGNGAVLLLAALFEEYIRQQAKTAFKSKADRSTDMSGFPEKVTSKIWRKSLELLARQSFDEILRNKTSTDARVRAIIAFCLDEDVKSDVSHAIAHNENNMRPDEINGIFSNIGVKNVIGLTCKNSIFRDFLNEDAVDRASAKLRLRIEEFFRRRNGIAHAIQLGMSSGPTELEQDIEFFRQFAQALSTTLQQEI